MALETVDVVLITTISNLILQPVLQYIIHSRCSKIKMGCLECEREILKSKEELNNQKQQEEIEF